MGMFQPQNYGADFVNAMTATSGMLNDRRKLDMEEKKQAMEAQQYAKADETRNLQNQGLKLENQKKSADLEREKRLTSFLDLTNRMQSGQLQPQDYGTLAGVTSDLMQDTPYLPSDPAEIPKYKQSINQLLEGVQAVRNLPVGNYTYTRADNNPQVNQALDGFRTLLSKDRLGKEFTDTDGSVTGKAGSTYRTADVGGFSMVSGNGKEAAFVPMFSVTDAQGNPLVRQDGKPVLVPSTVGQTNGTDDKVRLITPEEMMTKAGFAYKVLDTADKLGLADPEKRKEYIAANLPAYMGEKGAEQVLKANQKDNTLVQIDPTKDVYKGGVKMASGTREKKVHSVAPGGKLYDDDGTEVANNPAPKKAPATAKGGAGGGMLQEYAFNEETGRYDVPVGKPYPAHAPKEGKGDGGKPDKGLPVGTVSAINGEVVTRFIPVAESELKRKGKSTDLGEATDADKEMGLHVSASGVYKSLSLKGQQVFNRTKVLAQQYTREGANPSEAVEMALKVARKEHGLDDNGMVQQPQTAPRGMAPAKQATPAKKAAKPAQTASAGYVYQNGKLVRR